MSISRTYLLKRLRNSSLTDGAEKHYRDLLLANSIADSIQRAILSTT